MNTVLFNDSNYYLLNVIDTLRENIRKDNIMLKTLTFAILHFSLAFGIAPICSPAASGFPARVALIEPLVNTVVFYFHEKAWRL